MTENRDWVYSYFDEDGEEHTGRITDGYGTLGEFMDSLDPPPKKWTISEPGPDGAEG